jgi:hypothetical protein
MYIVDEGTNKLFKFKSKKDLTERRKKKHFLGYLSFYFQMKIMRRICYFTDSTN